VYLKTGALIPSLICVTADDLREDG